MCEGVDVCPGTGESIENAPCKVKFEFSTPVQSVVNQAWTEYETAMIKEERMRIAVENGGTGFSLMMGQY